MSAAPRSEPVEICLRCGAVMDWRHQTWQCPRCGFKLGCCEGETGECATRIGPQVSQPAGGRDQDVSTGVGPAPTQ